MSGSILRPINAQLQQVQTVVFKNEIRVKATTLDNWIAGREIQSIDLLRMDVQRAEGKVLSGAKETLSKVKCICLECGGKKAYAGQSKPEDLAAILNDFALIQSYPDGNHLFIKHHNHNIGAG